VKVKGSIYSLFGLEFYALSWHDVLDFLPKFSIFDSIKRVFGSAAKIIEFG
jgi:hypothetical protein